MTPEDKIRRGEEAERLLKNETLAQAFADATAEIRGAFYSIDYNEQAARAAHAANASLEALRLKLRDYATQGSSEAAHRAGLAAQAEQADPS